MVKKNACVFISGKGTNLKSLILNSNSYNFPIKIKLIISNKINAPGLLFAKKWSIPYLIFKKQDCLTETKIINEIKKKKINLICLAGYMRILSKKFINSFGKTIINIHPSLLPKFKGVNTFQRIITNHEKRTGCTVHYVNDKLDSGKIILKKYFFIDKNDNVDSLRAKTQKLEYKAYSEAIIKVFNKS